MNHILGSYNSIEKFVVVLLPKLTGGKLCGYKLSAGQSIALNSLLATNPLTVHVPACIIHHFPKFTVTDLIYLTWTSCFCDSCCSWISRDTDAHINIREIETEIRGFFLLAIHIILVINQLNAQNIVL